MGNDVLGKGMIKVQLNNLKDKIKIIKNESKLHGEETFIYNDMTELEREIQKALRSRAKG